MGLEGVEILMEAEQHFGITITDDEARSVRTVEDLYQLVMRKASSLPGPAEDRPCRQCRYNLRGSDSPTCPECGCEVWLSSDENAVETWKQLTSIIAETLSVERKTIRPKTRFVEDLRAG